MKRDTRGTEEERFWKYVKKGRDDECWEWQGALKNNGKYGTSYGLLGVLGKQKKAHRISYEIHKGLIPEGMYVCHSCDNMKCCNPKHLWIGSHNDNMKDKKEKGRARGGRFQKLTNEEVSKIIELYFSTKITQNTLAKFFGVTQQHIQQLIKRKGRSIFRLHKTAQ